MGMFERLFGAGGTVVPFGDIEAGMVFKVKGGDLCKVVHTEERGVHVVTVDSTESIDVGGMSMSMGGMHMPMSRASWEASRPRMVRTDPVEPHELEGYEVWRADGGGWF